MTAVDRSLKITAASGSRRRTRRAPQFTAVRMIVALIAGLLAVAPLLWALNTALGPASDAASITPKLSLGTMTLENFGSVLVRTDIVRYMLNTTIVGVGAAVLSSALALLAAYAAVRLPSRAVNVTLLVVLALGMLPGIAVLPGLYATAQTTGLHDTYLVLILVYAAWRLPILVWLMRAYLEAVPKEIDEAAFIDGLGRFAALFRVTVPLVAPGLLTCFLMTLVHAWNDFIFAVTLTISPGMRTVQVGLYQFLGDNGVQWAPFMAYTVLSTLPMLLLFVVLQKRFVEGLTSGAAKG